MVTDYSVEKNCEKLCFDEFVLRNYEICRLNENKKYAIGQLNP